MQIILICEIGYPDVICTIAIYAYDLIVSKRLTCDMNLI